MKWFFAGMALNVWSVNLEEECLRYSNFCSNPAGLFRVSWITVMATETKKIFVSLMGVMLLAACATVGPPQSGI
jgi:hypothetical protein